jgi:hypothetical protein
VEHLQRLALYHRRTAVAQDLDGAGTTRGEQAQQPDKDEIADQQGQAIAPSRVDGGLPASQLTLVVDVVVDKDDEIQSASMGHLYRCSFALAPPAASHPRCTWLRSA